MILHRMKLLFSLKPKSFLLLIEAALFIAWARFSLLYKPFSVLAAKLGASMEETDFVGRDLPDCRRRLAEIRGAVELMSKYTFWESKCLVRAVAAMKMLERRGIESTLYLGTSKDQDGKLIAHAWLRSGSYYITGASERKGFAVTGKFAKYIK
ncbi:lasso peptide biosynthesis B2 protein [Paenibacillus sp. HB172176]|uniref:lasso peptide biosynthesis B2 protein n=1 Tax=Paenibacillus sp. HB172176 TaxID=2493690 RepID=UPI00143B86F5|nr:lasso peptide biosynthesis B2 protein [Paenibacillus sp. HB172176]